MAQPRQALPNVTDLDALLRVLGNAKRIVVLSGAGISVSCGVPDFRSKGGLYDMVKDMGLGLEDPQCVFELETFLENPLWFYSFAHNLVGEAIQPSPTHRFLAMLRQRGRLLRNYTQNIDGLEVSAGVTSDTELRGSAGPVVACHGSLATATCLDCKQRWALKDIEPAMHAGRVPLCPKSVMTKRRKTSSSSCSSRRSAGVRSARLARKPRAPAMPLERHRQAVREAVDRGECGGVIKPDVTFFGERLDKRVGSLLQADKGKADLVLVIGTSLQVAPMSGIPAYFPPDVPLVLINRTPVALRPKGSQWDLQLLGDCDDIVRWLCARLAWALPSSSPPHPPQLTIDAGAGDWEARAAVQAGSGGEKKTTKRPRRHVGAAARAFGSTRGVEEEGMLPSPVTLGRVSTFAQKAAAVDVSAVAASKIPDEGGEKEEEFEYLCDGCGEAIVEGRYHCSTCFDVDFCKACSKGEQAQKHGSGTSGESKHVLLCAASKALNSL